MSNHAKIVKVWILSILSYVILFFAVVIILLLTGCVTSPEEEANNPLDLWQQGNSCVHLYYNRKTFTHADSGSTCSDGSFAIPVGHRRKQVADNCGESLFLTDYHVIYGCLKQEHFVILTETPL